MLKSRRGQLFLIEVIVALVVLIILITTLFSIQTFSPPPSQTNLQERGENVIDILEINGIIYDYFDLANDSYYIDNNRTVPSSNLVKTQVINTISSNIPTIADFKAFSERYNPILGNWERIDIIKFDTDIPNGVEIEVAEFYSPGFYGEFDQFKFQLLIWYEVNV